MFLYLENLVQTEGTKEELFLIPVVKSFSPAIDSFPVRCTTALSSALFVSSSFTEPTIVLLIVLS